MWAHYARSHSGLVLGLDSAHEWFRCGHERELVAVAYSHNRPHRRILSELTMEHVFATKSSEWAYEQEWRVLDSIAAVVAEPLPQLLDCFPFDLDPSVVREVIVGCRANSVLHRRVRRILTYDPYRHVQMYVASLNDMDVSMSFKRVRLSRHRKGAMVTPRERGDAYDR